MDHVRSIEIPQPEDRTRAYRFFEILPGALTWLILLLPFILGFISLRLTAYFVVAYMLLWFVRALGINFRSLQGFRRMSQHKKLPWRQLNQDLEELAVHTHAAPRWHAQNVERVGRTMLATRIKPSEIYHAAVILFYNESIDVVRPTVQSVLASDYDPKRIILILAYEQRGGPAVEATAKTLVKEFGSHFYHAEAIMHPADIAGEVIGKGGNATFAGRRLKKYLEAEKIEPSRVLVTTLDSDNRPDKQYFGALTYTYCSTEDPKYVSYQPIPMFLNNIWDAPAPMRVVATANSFWMVVQSLRPHMLRNFSSHAQSMETLIDTDFWSVRTIVEDGHQFWRTYFRYDGRHDVYPIFTPIYQDAVLAETYVRTLKMQFLQVRRWAWGVSDIAYVAHHGFLKKNQLPKRDLIIKFLRLLEGHVSWSTAPLLLLLAALVPFFIHPNSFIANQLPQIASKVQTLAMVGILITLFLSLRTLPPKPERYKKHRNLWMILQWVYLPITTITYSSFAAIYSQTRLMFGWYLGWVVTEKAVRK